MDTYEKKYKEAMKACKELSDAFDNETLTEELEKIFPELKESEDERMIREIKRYIKEQGDKPTGLPNGTVAVADMIAWLEKQGNLMGALQEANKKIGELVEENYYLKEQGEQKPADNVIEEEKSLLERFKKAVYACAWEKVTCKVEGESKEEYANRWAEQLLMLVRDWADDYIDSREDVIRRRFFDKGKQSMQESVWSEEDDDKINSIKYLLHELDNYNFDNWFKSLKNKVQPKQEWSEEDERLMKNLKSTLANLSARKLIERETKDKYVNWLKSLKPQNRWKPSEEQMKVLAEVIRNPHLSTAEYNGLIALAEQLKVL